MRVAVYCGASVGFDEILRESAKAFASHVASQGVGVVYGGGNIGLMGLVAEAALAAGGEVIGVIPESLLAKELGHRGVTQLHVTQSMHERKQKMVDLSDAFVALPGGFGTLDELFETLTWLQLGFHRKPVGLLNVGGFFDSLLTFLDEVRDRGFLRAEHRDCLLVGRTPEELLQQLLAFVPPDTEKWMQSLNPSVR